MCVGFWSLEHPDYALILCTNRDEYLSRPTTTAYWHSFEFPINEQDACTEESNNSSNKGSVLSGRDLRAGGTWLGINRHGDVAFLTNITEDVKPFSTTRGELTSSFLLSDVRPQDLRTYLDGVIARNAQYAGFNLLLLAPRPCSSSNSTAPDDSPGGGGIVSESNDAKQNIDGASPYPTTSIPTASRATWTYDAAYLTNHGGGGDLASRPLTETERRFGALSNGIDGLDANEWPKVQHGLRMFEDILDEYSRGRRSQNTQIEQVRDSNDGDLPLVESDLVERLFNLLTWKNHVAPTVRSELRNTILIDPMRDPVTSEETWVYGTRLSTVILVRRDGSVLFIERDIWKLDSEGQIQKGDWPKGDRVHSFQLASRDS